MTVITMTVVEVMVDLVRRDLVTSFSSVPPQSYSCKKVNSDTVGHQLGNGFFPRVSR